ncbi:hypothetical protein GUJ93_ZPchr0002g23237 [Zizania palustris]|uniref:Uncharacterized protein n=1 Tax=Zizania palustris TaxID=103762 RepID=A0A8J5SJ71_ZIZPA|nr:hypothetical protein GUJ93_ZPchr0002g23237 [Zizania palustris]
MKASSLSCVECLLLLASLLLVAASAVTVTPTDTTLARATWRSPRPVAAGCGSSNDDDARRGFPGPRRLCDQRGGRLPLCKQLRARRRDAVGGGRHVRRADAAAKPRRRVDRPVLRGVQAARAERAESAAPLIKAVNSVPVNVPKSFGMER